MHLSISFAATSTAVTNKKMENQPASESKNRGVIKWLKRLGWAGFFFFLIKGLIWIAVFYGGLQLVKC